MQGFALPRSRLPSTLSNPSEPCLLVSYRKVPTSDIHEDPKTLKEESERPKQAGEVSLAILSRPPLLRKVTTISYCSGGSRQPALPETESRDQ